MKKSTKTSKVTLQAIGDLIEQKLDQRLKYTDAKIVGIYGEIDGVKKEVKEFRFEFEEFRQETQQNFNTVFDGLSNLGNTVDKNMEPRLKRVEQKLAL